MHRGCVRGDVACAPSEAEKFCIFEIEIVQFNEYFWVQVHNRQWIKKNKQKQKQIKTKQQQQQQQNSSMDLADPFCILGEILVNSLLES